MLWVQKQMEYEKIGYSCGDGASEQLIHCYILLINTLVHNPRYHIVEYYVLKTTIHITLYLQHYKDIVLGMGFL